MPVEVVPQDGVFEAYHNGRCACQREMEPSSAYVQGEDCLYLNIWRADGSASGRPVMVWFHGGGFEIGGTFDPGYDFGNFVREHPDVVVVSAAYRLGALGFLCLAHLSDGGAYPDAQNLGLLDQLAALRWVHDNIAGFGGDPDDVTIRGESAGAGSVTMLALLAGSHDVIDRVIAQSGSPAMTRSIEQAEKTTNDIMDALGCSSVADLMRVDAQGIVRAAGEVASMRLLPVRDGRHLPLDTFSACGRGAVADIDLLIGCNKDEMCRYVSSMGVDAYVRWAEELKARKLAQLTDEEQVLVEGFCRDVVGDDYEHVSRLLDQVWFRAPAIRTAEAQATAGGSVHAYLFCVESTLPLARSGHGMELTCVLGHPEMAEGVGMVVDETFAATMRAMWVQFARCGDPSLTKETSVDGVARTWPAYDACDRRLMVFEEHDIHVEREAERQVADWDRTYFLTRHHIF